MTKLTVSPEVLANSLFQGACPEVRIVGASFDHFRNVVLLEIEGPGIPDAPEVLAVCHKVPPLVIEFKER